MPASDTGALEAALWCLLGDRGIDILAWENFGKDWVIDVVDQEALLLRLNLRWFFLRQSHLKLG